MPPILGLLLLLRERERAGGGAAERFRADAPPLARRAHGTGTALDRSPARLDALHADRRLTPIPPPLAPHSLGTHKRAINKRADIQQYYADQRSAAAGQ